MPSGEKDVHRILVIANETCPGRTLADEIERRAAGRPVEVLVVAPALTARLRHLFSDIDGALRRANARLQTSVAALAEAGVMARGEVGDENPLQAITDALRTFQADEIIISTHPPGRSNWLEKKVVAEAIEQFSQPITHIVVDLEKEEATVHAVQT